MRILKDALDYYIYTIN